MTTEAKILANRLNAQKSTGPQTPQGKAVVSQNALKHGLSARCDVVITESQADFDLHRDSLLAELAPQTPMESILADRIVSLSWRLKRADLIQNQTIDAMHEESKTNPLAKLAKSFGLKGLPVPQGETLDSNPDLILGRIALKDFSNERVLDRLLMYERRIEHSLYKTTLELQRLHLLRNLDPPDEISNPQPQPQVRPVESPPVAERIEHRESSIEHRASRIEKPASRIIPGLRKTNPISKSPKPTQPLLPQRVTPISRSAPPQKTKPIKPNLSRRSLWRSRIKPNPPEQCEIRNTNPTLDAPGQNL